MELDGRGKEQKDKTKRVRRKPGRAQVGKRERKKQKNVVSIFFLPHTHRHTPNTQK